MTLARVFSGVLPRSAIGHKFPLCFTSVAPEFLLANLSSFVLDYVARQKFAGTSMAYFVLKQLPILPPTTYNEPTRWLGNVAPASWIRARVLELAYTAWDMEAFARDLGDGGAPFRWDQERRAVIRAELDAAFFHLYGLERDEVEHVMDSFAVLRDNEKSELGEFCTRRLILERYDAIAKASQTTVSYQAILNPPPGHGARHPRRDALKGAELG